MSDQPESNPPLQPPSPAPPASSHSQPRGGPAPTLLSRLDVMMADHPWFPRVVPFLTYLVLLTVTSFVGEREPVAYPFLYLVQIFAVVWLLWRYRSLLPELTLSFHWLAIPTGIIVFLAWNWLGMVIDEWTQMRSVGLATFTTEYAKWSIDPSAPLAIAADGKPLQFIDTAARADSVFRELGLEQGRLLAWFAFISRLLGMSIVVPLFEELFIRSLLLRSFNSRKNTFVGVIQVAQDFPIIGERLMGTKLAEEADKQPPMFEHEFKRVPLGTLSVFGVLASTVVFALSHAPRDWAGCVFCGIAYCLCLHFTRHKGLGPVVWAHGITNALIWYYTLHTDDWRFL